MFSIDLHFHTAPRSACSHMAPEAALAAAVRTGLDAVVLTEHHELWTPEELEPLRRKWPQLLVLAGAEINCEQGHFLVYGLNDLDGVARDMPAERLIELAHEAGGAVVAAHPYRWSRQQGDACLTLDIDGVEIDSNNTTAEGRMLAERLARAKGVPGLIASDAHAVDVVGRYRQEFAEPLRTIRDLVDLLRRPSPAGAEQAPNGP